MTRVLRAAVCACALTASLAAVTATGRADGPPQPAQPQAPRIHLKGSARLDAHAARASGRLVLSGTVVDDTARPLPGARVAVSITRASDALGVAPLSLSTSLPEPCSDGGARPILDRADVLVLPTDDAARFCVRLGLATDRYVAHLESRASGLVDAATLDLPLDLALKPVTLRFDPERPVLSLDDETTTLEVVASTEEDGVTTAAVGVALALSNEAGAALGTMTTSASGRARFLVDGARLGPPGRGELRVSFAGSTDAGASTHALQIERRTRVDVVAPEAIEGRLPLGSPEEGMTVRLAAVPRCARRGCTGTATGTVEARVGDAIVGAASFDQAQARLVVTFAMPTAGEVPLRVRYVPDAPWFQPGAELLLTQPVRAPSPWKKIPLVLAGLAVVAWLVLARMPARTLAAASRASRPPPLDRPEAGVELLREGPASRGWVGRVRDTHDGFAIAGARVAVERRGFERVDVVGQVFADAAGAFAIPPFEARSGDEVVIEGPLHAALRRPLPPPGEVEVLLVLRKRALLDRLVAWARRRGLPYDSRPEPTPAHVRRAAGAEFAVARWADAVERAAYGGAVVDQQAQGEVDRLAPGEPAGPAGAGAVVARVDEPGGLPPGPR
jgi:hypothetical protein